MKIAIVGFGYVGLTLGCVLAQRYKVIGIDVNESLINQLNQGTVPIYEPGLEALFHHAYQKKLLTMTSDFSLIQQSNVIIVTVGTPLNDMGQPDLTSLHRCIAAIQPQLNHHQLIILKSTVPPGTTESLFPKHIIEQFKLSIAFCPERLAEGQALADLKRLPIVVGGIDEKSGEIVEQFWQQHTDVKTIRVANSRTAEMIKLANNLWIDVNIALANELAQLCYAMNVDVMELIGAANTLPKGQHFVNFLWPSIGVGGSCLTKDPWFVAELAKQRDIELKLPALCRHINEGMPAYTVRLIDNYFSKKNKTPADTKIAVLGLAFKSDTNDMRASPVIPIIEQLENLGYQVNKYDPLVGVGDLSTTLANADMVAFFTGHQMFHELSLATIAQQVKIGALLFDGRMYFSNEKIQQAKSLGLDYLGIGRSQVTAEHWRKEGPIIAKNGNNNPIKNPKMLI